VKKSRARFSDHLLFPIAIGILDHRVGEYSAKLRGASAPATKPQPV
jgi:hypothetical protein